MGEIRGNCEYLCKFEIVVLSVDNGRWIELSKSRTNQRLWGKRNCKVHYNILSYLSKHNLPWVAREYGSKFHNPLNPLVRLVGVFDSVLTAIRLVMYVILHTSVS